MHFRYDRSDSLPALAWCGRLRRGCDEVRVRHGCWVEVRADGFFEGAWDGPFDGAGPVDAVSFAGTAGSARRDAVVFASSTSLSDRLFAIERGDELVVSNSLVFALVAAGDAPAPDYRYYGDRVLQQIRAGIRSGPPSLPTRRGEVRLVICGNLEVGRDLAWRRREKPAPPAPASFEDYVALLGGSMQRVFANAADPRRIVRYAPLAPVTQGYDGNAVAALAARCGCREAFTFTPSESRRHRGGDDGSAVGARLGLRVTARPIDAWVARAEELPEAEFCVHPHGGDVTLAGIEDLLVGRLLLTGRPGDGLWDPAGDLGPELQRSGWSGVAGATMGEFRLRTGFVDYDPVFTGWQHAEQIRRLGRSPEMRPWSVGGTYDRPIPRRIVEAAGVPRELFGRRKVSGGYYALRWREALCAPSRADFAAWLRSVPRLPRLRLRAARARLRLTRWLRRLPGLRARAPRGQPYLSDGFLVHWGFARTRARYGAPPGPSDARPGA